MLLRTPLLASVFGLLVSLVVDASAAGAPVATSDVFATSTPAATTTVSIVLKDGKMAASVKAASAGRVTFAVKNSGKQSHQFVVIRSNLHHHLLPTKGNTAALAGVKAKTKVGRNSTKRLTLNLAPGKYVLICNEPGHYKRGEYLAFTVKAGTTTPVEPKTTEVNVSMFEMGFKLSKTKVPRGTVVFHIKNDGKVPHDFSFGSRGGGSPLIQAGQRTDFTVTFAKPGKYTFICTVEGHYAAGMYGVLTVV